jgi:hypothetical protein
MLSKEELGIMELCLLLQIPAYELLDKMPYDEFLAWFEYMNIRPPGWKEDRRAFLQMAVHNNTLKQEELFPSLKAIREGIQEETSKLQGLEKSFIFQMMQKSVGGEQLGL